MKVMAWKARSQAANQGYSQSSGMEKMWYALTWGQYILRPFFRAGGGVGCAGSPSSHCRTS